MYLWPELPVFIGYVCGSLSFKVEAINQKKDMLLAKSVLTSFNPLKKKKRKKVCMFRYKI